MAGKLTVYTVLLGHYETLNEQPMQAASQARFLCLTDNPALRSDSWEILPVTPLLPRDPVRSQRHLKLSPHRIPALADAEWSLYIDNRIVLTQPPEAVLDRYGPADCVLPSHSFHATVLDEYRAVLDTARDAVDRVTEQLLHLLAEAPFLLPERPWWSAIQLRRHASPPVIAAMELWLAQVLRYSRRDQLSANLAFHRTGLVPTVMEIDNIRSDFHVWLDPTDRLPEPSGWTGADTTPVERDRVLGVLAAMAFVPRETAALQHSLAVAERAQAATRRTLLAVEETLAAKEQALATTQQALVTTQQAEAMTQQALAAARQAQAVTDHALAATKQALAARDRSLAALRDSSSWRLTAPLRGLARALGRR